ncbi:14116_t:CDS:2, partial [Racocetra persica]
MGGDSSTQTVQSYGRQIFQELLNDNLLERARLIEFLLYEEGVEDFLVTLSEKICQMALNSVLLKKSTQWLTTWSTNLENRLNNYKCAAYMLLEKTIRITFKQAHSEQYHSQLILNYTESWTVPKKIISLKLAEFTKIISCLNVLSFEDIEYVCDTRSKMTTIIPGADFIQFMYYLESLILQLFEKYIEYGPNILIYINNNLLSNQPLKEQFNNLLQIAYKIQSENQKLLSKSIYDHIQLSKETEDYLLARLIKIYMRSRQRSWQQFKEYIPEKGSSSLRENVKAMNSDLKNDATKENKLKI